MRFFYIVLSVLVLSCSKDTTVNTDDDTIQTPVLTDEVLVYNVSGISNNLVLANDLNADEIFLLQKDGTIYHEWTLENELGNDAFLEEDGKLLALLKTDDDKIMLGGAGGQIQLINPDNSIDWKFVYSTDEYSLHHDIERLPNGNIIALIWEKKSNAEAKEKGYLGESDVYIESIIEINPETNNIVWKWSSWDHLIQDHDPLKNNYMSIFDNPQLIDINYNIFETGDIMHANAIEYDIKNDLIYVSVNFYNEIWVIDHSTTTSNAATNSGGNFNKGGNLLYRFGNPPAYKSDQQSLFSNNHHCNFIKENLPGAGNLLVFGNGTEFSQSTVYEFELPKIFDFAISPSIKWSFTDTNLFSGKVSGAVRTENGNTLITEGDFGYWEVTESKETVWLYNYSGFFWRAYPYDYDSQAILNLK